MSKRHATTDSGCARVACPLRQGLSEFRQRNQEQTKVKREDVRKPHVVMTHRAIDTLSREEFLAAKYGGLEFTRPEHKEPVNLIEPERKPEPMRFSLANLIPAGV